jgi:hypothetical protein
MKYIILSLLAVVCAANVLAQGSFIMSYPISFPMGDLHDYTTKTSFRGINLEFLKEAKPHVEVGIETGWNVFYSKEQKADYKQGTATISGVQFRYTNAVPILAEVRFLPESGSHVANAYAGLGVGTLYVDRSTDFGLYRINSDAWQFCLRPEAGVLFNIEPGVKAMIGVKYYAAFHANDLNGQSFLSTNIGIVFTSL